MTIEVNSIDAKTRGTSAALIEGPIEGGAAGKISTTGNATVKTDQVQREIGLPVGEKRLKAKSANNLWAMASAGRQLDTGIAYFDIFFGIQGQKEKIDELGEKNRPHIAIFPDGNGKFVRLSGYDFEIETDMAIDQQSGEIEPNTCRIKLADFNEKLVLKFATDSNNVVILSQISFESA